jgi:hypothetical protein
MTTNSPQQPDPSQDKSSGQPQGAQPRGGYNPVTLEDVQKTASAQFLDSFGNLNVETRWLAAPLFILIFFFSQLLPPLAPLTILVLLGCLLARLEPRIRQIAAVPLTISTIMLSFRIIENYAGPTPSSVSDLFRLPASEYGLPWLPLFFSACIFYIPTQDSVTFKMVLAESFLLLASGLIPGSGFLAIFFMIYYTLFFAIVVAIFVDIKNHNLTVPLRNTATVSQ